MSKDLHELTKKMLAAAQAKADAARDKQLGTYNDKARKAANQPLKTSKTKAVKNAAPAKAAKNPATSAKPPKMTPEKVRKAAMEKPVAKAAPKAKASSGGNKPPPPPKSKMMSANPPEKSGMMGEVKDATKKAKRHAELMAEHAGDLGDNVAMELERDLPKGAAKLGERIAVHEESEAAKAAGKGAMKALKRRMLTEGLESAGKKAMMGAVIGGPVGLGLSALMESLDAEETNPEMHDRAAESASRREAGLRTPDFGKTAPREKLPTKLPSETKKPKLRQEDFTADADGTNEDQARMENAYARELKKWPR